MNANHGTQSLRAMVFDALRRPVGVDYHGWRSFGWLMLLLLMLALVTGGLLTIYYEPVSDRAPESLRALMRDVRWGWLVRGVHHWSAHGLLALALALGVREVATGGYRGNRASLWVLGGLVLALLVGATFTGVLLRWDEPAVRLLRVTLDALESFPVLGPALVRMLAGGDEIGPATLERLHAIHVFLVPFAIAAALVAGLWTFVRMRELGAGSAAR